MFSTKISAIEYYLPKKKITNDDLNNFCDIDTISVFQKLGIAQRHFVDKDETSSTMAINAAKTLLKKNGINGNEIDFLIAVTQNPDNILPGIAPLIQKELPLKLSLAAFDVNLACSGFTYALSIADSFIKSRLFNKGIIVTSDCYSRRMNMRDKKVCTLFGDAASATLVEKSEDNGQFLSFDFGTDGVGYDYLTIPAGGIKNPFSPETSIEKEVEPGNFRSANDLYMNGKEIFGFVMEHIPISIQQTIRKANKTIDDITYFVFHQANNYMLKALSRRMGLPDEKVILDIENYGNTVSSTIPICLANLFNSARINKGDLLLLSGFGVGLSYCSTLYQV